MKELSIEEKARRYDEAIERAESIYNEIAIPSATTKGICTYIFPELAESEDDMIRKSIIAIINNYVDNSNTFKPKIIAWLEKQGMPAKYHDICDTCVRQPTCQSDCFLQQSEQKQEVEGNPNARKPTLRIIKGKSYLCIKDYRDKNCTFTKGKIYESDKDGFLVDDEEKDTFERKIWEEDAIEYFFLFEQSKPKNIVTDKKQKLSTKVEPKFHKGEWLCENEPNNYARFIQILETVNVQGKERCKISRDIHNDEDIVEFDFVEKYYHKFDIRDAKDGDVLARNNDILSICIFSHFDGINDKFSSFLCHCGLEGEELGQKLSINGYHDDSKNYVPATKEQRNLLFKKMHEAGYEWDADRLELKKIEQKPAWSEEDERMYRGLHNLIYSTLYCNSRKESSDWLKSLKDRVQPQNTWKPSDEQMKALEEACDKHWEPDGLDPLYTLYQDLKKLREE